MSEFLNILTHGRRLKAATKELSVAQLEEVSNKLDKVIAVRREEEAQQRQQEAAKQRKIDELRQAMTEAGIGVEDLVGEAALAATPKTRRKRAPKPPKYAIIDANGERITWTGQGRMPNALKAAIVRGESIDNYLIK
ncbi:H-NS family nucleoid-associated regulatory protein [Pseudidiomarina sp.]|uniref:H-NS family histone-like protein n=1 Tax=Pseudidiomarina sp. TaxID=2081707 RepID=UPI00299F3B26|nr:H-NS family nucleoid-associated regulatory protein [Pseudidiomarina sp.]MDX1704825.1 H-NS family nucleoid-associated regulatory protein [Pseudidiomarina sp.]